MGVTEPLICCLDNLSREVCCVPVECVRDIRKALPQLIKLEGYYLFTFIQAGSQDAATRKLKNI